MFHPDMFFDFSWREIQFCSFGGTVFTPGLTMF